MRGRSCGSLLAILLLTLCSAPALWGQASASSPARAGSTPFHPQPPKALPGPDPVVSAPAFPQLARSAGMILAGTVTRIERGPAAGGTAVATVAVTFHVERALRGVLQGGNLTILEWLGLWSSGQRYAVGEHVLVFLYPLSKLGLTSSVGGSLGQFHLDLAGEILLSEQQSGAF